MRYKKLYNYLIYHWRRGILLKKSKKTFLSLFFISIFILSGCAGDATESEATAESTTEVKTEAEPENKAYTISLKKGLAELEAEDFEKAAAYFDIALEELPGDERASTLLNQTEHYIEANAHFNEEAYEKAQVKAEVVQSIENGSDILVQRADALLEKIADIEAEKAAIEQLKGIFVEFNGEPYESNFNYIYLLTEKEIFDGYRDSHAWISNVKKKSYADGKLTMQLESLAMDGSVEGEYEVQLDVNTDGNGYRYLEFDTGVKLYPITTEDFYKGGFDFSGDKQHYIDELKAYDKNVPRTIDFLANYSAKQIEYARVWLNVMDNPNVSELHVYIQPAGETIAPSVDSAVYPEDVTFVSGMYGYEGHVAYSGNGDGTINIYHVPTHWHADPKDWTNISEDILNTELVYLEPLDDLEVATLIERIDIAE